MATKILLLLCCPGSGGTIIDGLNFPVLARLLTFRARGWLQLIVGLLLLLLLLSIASLSIIIAVIGNDRAAFSPSERGLRLNRLQVDVKRGAVFIVVDPGDILVLPGVDR